MSVSDPLLENNRAYVQAFDKGELPARPAKQLAVLACMDARLDVYKILGLTEGDAHVIRNAGGIASEDALRSLLISQRLLGTRSVVVIQHTQCGMLNLPEAEVEQQIETETGESLPFRLQGFSDLEQETKRSLTRIKTSSFLPHRDDVRGFIYDVRTGSLREVPAT